MNKGQNTRGYERYMALDIHREYILVGAQDEAQGWVLTPHHDEVLAIKLEIDMHPPAGAGLATRLIQHHVDVHVQHHDQATLLAGKLHAFLQRAHIKGREWYALYWYLRQPDWAKPNIDMLNQALTQTGWSKEMVTENNWRGYVQERLAALEWQRVVADVERFVIDQQGFVSFSKAAIEELL